MSARYAKNRKTNKVLKLDQRLIHSCPFTIRPLPDEDGDGFSIEYPDLPGCISDGQNPEEALMKAYLMICAMHGDAIPQPGTTRGQWRQRVPRSLHARLVSKAREEGVSLNTLMTSMIAEGLGQRRSLAHSTEGGEAHHN